MIFDGEYALVVALAFADFMKPIKRVFNTRK
jgi:hypothetical protein